MGPIHVILSLPLSHHTFRNFNAFSIHSTTPLNVISHQISELHQFNSWVSLCAHICPCVSVFIATVAGNMQPVFSTVSCCCFKPLGGLLITPTQTGTQHTNCNQMDDFCHCFPVEQHRASGQRREGGGGSEHHQPNLKSVL